MSVIICHRCFYVQKEYLILYWQIFSFGITSFDLQIKCSRIQIGSRMEKFTTAVQETGISRHNGSPIDGSLGTTLSWYLGIFRAALNWAPTMSRDASVSNDCTPTCCSFFVWVMFNNMNNSKQLCYFFLQFFIYISY